MINKSYGKSTYTSEDLPSSQVSEKEKESSQNVSVPLHPLSSLVKSVGSQVGAGGASPFSSPSVEDPCPGGPCPSGPCPGGPCPSGPCPGGPCPSGPCPGGPKLS